MQTRLLWSANKASLQNKKKTTNLNNSNNPQQNDKTMARETKYEAAMSQLEYIVKKMENGELDVDSLSEQLKVAQKLIKQCKDKLTKTDDEIRKILAQE